MMIADGWPRERTELAGVPYTTLPRSPRPTPCCGGTASSSRESGPAPGSPDAARRCWIFDGSSYGWPQRIRGGAPGGTLHYSAHPQAGGPAARAAPPDLVADVSESALGRHRWSRFLHDG